MEVLKGLKAARSKSSDPTNPYVIPGKKKVTHGQGVEKFWQRVRKQAKLEDVRIHDLWHRFAAIAAGQGMSLHMIATLLGHRQPTRRRATCISRRIL